jgi:hypothetical protein
MQEKGQKKTAPDEIPARSRARVDMRFSVV